jgi:succinoglycan biosynthesis transport protein ExoP
MQEQRSTPESQTPEPDTNPPPIAAAPLVSPGSSAVRSFLFRLWRGKWPLLTSVAAFSLIALMLGATQDPLYRVQTAVQIERPHTTYQDLQSHKIPGSPPLESYLQTQRRIIESRSLVERILAKMNDAQRSRLLPGPSLFSNRPSYDQNVESIRRHIAAQVSEQDGIVDISFLSPDPAAGADFLNSLTQELADLNIERSWREAQRRRDWTDRQLQDLRRKWEQSEQVFIEYSQSSQLATAKTPAAALTLPDVTTQNAIDPKLRQLRTHLANINKQIAQWQSLYGPTSAIVLKLRSDAAITQTAIRRLQAFSAPIANAPAPIATPLAPVAHASESLIDRAHAIAHFNVLKQEAESNRRIYADTASRLQEASVASAAHIGDMSVIDPAIPVMRTAAPGQFLNGAVGAFTGSLLGIAFVMLRDRFSHTFAGPTYVSQYLGIGVLGTIPADRLSSTTPSFPSLSGEPALNLSFSADVQTAEAYRSIRSSILLGAGNGSGPRRLIFTSAGPAEGTTSVVGNLGAAIAAAQRRVLLVDGDLRNPALHKIFGTDNHHGLADLLSRQITSSPLSSRDVIRATQIPDLYLLSAGQAGARGPEILSSVQLPQLMREFAKGFDIVLLDSPPILPYADARSLAKAADAVILIVKAGATDRRSALLARDSIRQDGAPIIGAILTDCTPL